MSGRITIATAAALVCMGGLAPARVLADTGGAAMSATGAGHVNDGGGLRTFSFSATASGGRIGGQAQLDNRAVGTRAHVMVDCLVVSGSVAYVGGTIDRSTNPNLVGAPALFAVQDNGDARNLIRDQITGLFVGDSDCTNPDNQDELSFFPIQNGDIQVH